jgi:hypothetical protein
VLRLRRSVRLGRRSVRLGRRPGRLRLKRPGWRLRLGWRPQLPDLRLRWLDWRLRRRRDWRSRLDSRQRLDWPPRVWRLPN